MGHSEYFADENRTMRRNGKKITRNRNPGLSRITLSSICILRSLLDPVCHKPRPLQQNPIAPTSLLRPFLMAWSIDYLALSVLI